MRRAGIVLLVGVALAACGAGDDPGGPTASSGPPLPSPTISAPPSGPTGDTADPTGPTLTGPTPTGPSGPTAPIDLDLPADAPSVVDDPQALAEVTAGRFGSLAPPGARVVETDAIAGDVAVIWARGNDPFAAEHGFVLWTATTDPAGWRAVYAFTDGRRSGVLGVTIDGRADLTGDGIDELLTLESTGGSGACGVMRVLSPTGGAASEIFHREACDAAASLGRGHLVIREAVFGPNDPHCCPSAFRTTTYGWNGTRLVPGDVEEEPAG